MISLISKESFDKSSIKNKVFFFPFLLKEENRMFHWCFKITYNDFVNNLTNTQYNMHK